MQTDANGYLVQRAREALVGDARVGELGLDVRLAGDTLFVTGVVATDERRRVIGDLLGTLFPGQTIKNDVEVEEMHEPSAPEELS